MGNFALTENAENLPVLMGIKPSMATLISLRRENAAELLKPVMNQASYKVKFADIFPFRNSGTT